MKKTLMIAACGILLFTACNENKGNETAETTEAAQVTDNLPSLPVAAKTWNYDYKVTEADHAYSIALHREADRSQPMVTDADGVEYVDNNVRIQIHQDGKPLFERTFSKDAFSGHIAAADFKRCILQGIAFDRAENGILIFGGHVGSPDDDANYYFAIKVDGNGGLNIVRDFQQDTAGSDFAR